MPIFEYANQHNIHLLFNCFIHLVLPRIGGIKMKSVKSKNKY